LKQYGVWATGGMCRWTFARKSNEENKEFMKKCIIKYSNFVICLLVLLMIGTFFVCQYAVRELMVSDYNAVIGKLYLEDRVLAEKAAEYLYANELTEENLAAGSQAMKEFGYTGQGMRFAKTFDKRCYQAAGMVVLVLFLLLLLVLFWRKDKEKLFLAEERERLKEELVRSNVGEWRFLEKKSAMTQTYVENVAHQVRTPLANAMLNIALVYENQTEEDKEILDECTYHMERVNKLMERLLKIGRLEAGKVELAKQEENLAVLFRELKKQYLPGQVQLELVEAQMFFDYDWLWEAFSCLVENCLDHVGASCTVRISLTATEERAVITVEDNGEGFKEEDIPNLFERFYSTEKLQATGHYGIGLNLCKLIVEQHYGKIRAYNVKDGGAGFLVELPRYKLK